ncbi:hypothetical protein BJ166DRAFT_586951 [Pestalotiopsis sp. NC0098]|nr:hypothetical protein BJ166DRAFT_586951 [Pestalotiopsis sp. NC0098]
MAMPFAAYWLMRTGGVAAILIMAFMAVTSAETVATAAPVTYDVYKDYINEKATRKKLIRISHMTVIAFGILTSCIAVGLNHAGFSVHYLVTIGIFVDSAIIPMGCIIMLKGNPLSPSSLYLVSSVAAIIAWLLTAYTHYGEITNFDWEELKRLKVDRGTLDEALGENTPPHADYTGSNVVEGRIEIEQGPILESSLRKARTKAAWIAAFLCLSFLILWPIPMYGSEYVFSRIFFEGWVVVLFL